MILLGVAVGPIGFDLLPAAVHLWYEFLASAALSMMAFLLGAGLTLTTLRRYCATMMIVSDTVVAFTLLMVYAGLVALGATLCSRYCWRE